MTAIHQELQSLGERGEISKADPAKNTADRQTTSLQDVFPTREWLGSFDVINEGSAMTAPALKRRRVDMDYGTAGSTQAKLYLTYRRPLMRVFIHRGIDNDAAKDLLQRTFMVALEKIRTAGPENSGNLGDHLYRIACQLAANYRRTEFSRQVEYAGEFLINIEDESPSLEDRIDDDQLAGRVRELMRHLQVRRDREVLDRFYLREESRIDICRSMNLTDLQFSTALSRAKERFAEILSRAGARSLL
jgi:RNA polymerase sigma factor (sigma-70 family)